METEVKAEVVVPVAEVVVPTANEYLLTVKVKITALDDVDARAKAKDELTLLGIGGPEALGNREVKFQETKKNVPPRKVEL